MKKKVLTGLLVFATLFSPLVGETRGVSAQNLANQEGKAGVVSEFVYGNEVQNKGAQEVQVKVSAQEVTTKLSDWKYSIDTENNEIYLKEYIGKAVNIVIPAQLSGKAVRLGDRKDVGEFDSPMIDVAFLNNKVIKRVRFSPGVRAGNFNHMFENCTKLKEVIGLPSSIKYMYATFKNCSSLLRVDVLPSELESMDQTFFSCSSLVVAPEILQKVVSLEDAFNNCTSLVESPVIPAGVENMSGTFKQCVSLVEAPVIPAGVENMSSTFMWCDGLIKAPVLPDSLKNMSWTFGYCKNLLDAPEIPNLAIDMTSTFEDCFNLRTVRTYLMMWNF